MNISTMNTPHRELSPTGEKKIQRGDEGEGEQGTDTPNHHHPTSIRATRSVDKRETPVAKFVEQNLSLVV